MKEVNAPNCGRENDLVGFLYGELTTGEAQSFQRHLRDCASCNAELMAFRDVRESVVTWRNESLGIVSAPATNPAPAFIVPQKVSALAAVRAFFNLAPLWMKGAVAFASVLFVLFVGLAVAHWDSGQPVRTEVVTVPGQPSEDQLKALVDKRVQEELERNKSSEQKAAPSSNPDEVVQIPRRRAPIHSNESASIQKARRPLSRTEREQLATDLRLVSDRPEADFDLAGDRFNQ
jgi:hypothetical protein